jgi:hypothetical protein
MTQADERIRSRLRDEICARCRDEHPDSHCDPGHEGHCPLMRELDKVIAIVSGMRDYSLEPYQQKVRTIVCTSCQAAGGHGYEGCTHRQAHSCALDDYFPRIVAIVEDELKKDPGLPE